RVLRRTEVIASSPLVEIQSGSSKHSFICIHPVGGNLLCYAHLARSLGQDQSFYGFQMFDQDQELETFTCVEKIATNYVDLLCGFQRQGPYFIGGWSFGGLVALEMAQQLLQRGRDVGLLALFDTHISHSSHQHVDDTMLLMLFVRDLTGSLVENGPSLPG